MVLRELTFSGARLAVARFLVIFSFVWPFFNYQLAIPGSQTEINFLPVFLAALVVPEITSRNKLSILLSLPAFAVAILWGNATAPLRLAVGILPLHFLLNLTGRLREEGRELVPPGLAYGALQIFTGFSLLQTVDFQFFPVIPSQLTTILMTILPRYSGAPYSDFGIRGVQGWASEPSSAGLTCFAFALVSLHLRPWLRWRVIATFALFLTLNKSVYALVLFGLLIICNLINLRKTRFLVPTFILAVLLVTVYVIRSARIADLRDSIALSGMASWSNESFKRLGQILGPFLQFPRIYTPVVVTFATTTVLEPLGLLPLALGYGSLFGIAWLTYVLSRNFPHQRVTDFSSYLAALFVLLVMASPDFIPSVVALAIFAVPPKATGAGMLLNPVDAQLSAHRNSSMEVSPCESH